MSDFTSDRQEWIPDSGEGEPLGHPRVQPDGTPTAALDTADQGSYPVATGGPVGDPAAGAARPGF
ncbi:hypothetical protein [Amnibacterium sp.]|uniref:hypothetical protein n=1 Tax=Amnibacterium sp. TaxID=1872496 RepID=UPI00262FB574|nr:hypothetical protein [Amnibacterium sp.]MCU1472418.1 hypothetical protein [Amnibacterium sp.]